MVLQILCVIKEVLFFYFNKYHCNYSNISLVHSNNLNYNISWKVLFLHAIIFFLQQAPKNSTFK